MWQNDHNCEKYNDLYLYGKTSWTSLYTLGVSIKNIQDSFKNQQKQGSQTWNTVAIHFGKDI